MTYMGAKSKCAKYIISIIQEYINKNNIDTYIEPFVGGANIIQKIECKNKIGNDSHKYLIAMYKAIQNGWDFPMHISEEEYNRVRNNPDCYPDYYVGLVGFCATYGTKWFVGYARYKGRDMPNERLRRLKKESPYLQGIKFVNMDYKDLDIQNMKNVLVYCDPPYQNTTTYSKLGSINYNEYQNWVRQISQNNIVLCSEYNMPEDFKEIWRGNISSKLSITTNEKKCEKLFIFSGKNVQL